jgi:hypothetical protein
MNLREYVTPRDIKEIIKFHRSTYTEILANYHKLIELRKRSWNPKMRKEIKRNIEDAVGILKTMGEKSMILAYNYPQEINELEENK